jgi:hypothetical protein
MKFQRIYLFAFLISSLTAFSQEKVTAIATLSLPAGYVVGASIDADSGMIAVQQIQEAGEIIGLHRHRYPQVSIWSIQKQSMLATKQYGEIDASPNGVCGRIAILSHQHRILICSSYRSIDVLDATTLGVTGKMADGQIQQIYDFAADEKNNTLSVLALAQDGDIRLSVYSLLDGEMRGSETIPGENLSTMNIAADPITSRVAINISRDKRSGTTSDIYLCSSVSQPVCARPKHLPPISEIGFLGKQLLLVPSDANHKTSCILSMPPNSTAASPEYCAPQSGVHATFGVANRQFIVGFTGLSYYSIINEESKFASSSYSVWNAEQHLPFATVSGPPNPEESQRFGTVVTSTTSPMFLIYKTHSPLLTLYSIK